MKNFTLRAGITILFATLLFLILRTFFHASPIGFLLVFGIILSVVFFFVQRPASAEINNINFQRALLKRSSEYSVLFILILFFISVMVMKQYQLPSSNPYFTNVNHHAIKNSGIAFQDKLSLYGNKDHGIWKSDSGSFDIIEKDNNIDFYFSEFFTPVFVINNHKHQLINPIFNEQIQKEICVKDQYTSLTWNTIQQINDNEEADGVYDFVLRFKTIDPNLLNILQDPSVSQYEDTFHINNFTIKKGLLLKNLLSQMICNKPMSIDMANNWLNNKEAKIYLLNTVDNGKNQLVFFPTAPFFSNKDPLEGNLSVQIGGRNLQPRGPFTYRYYTYSEDKKPQHFFIDFSEYKKPLLVERLHPEHAKKLPNFRFQLIFNYPEYYPLAPNEDSNNVVLRNELRFLKNAFNYGDSLMQTEEGYFFHDDVQGNAYTQFKSTYLQYKIDKPGAPLNASLVNIQAKIGDIDSMWQVNNQTYFGLYSKNNKLTWIFELHDFSKNDYSNDKILLYLSIIVLAFLVLVVFFPSIQTRRIDTPILLLTYCLLVFRLLLLWRVATFPPLEDISSTEFDTLQNFDFRIIGSFKSPLPLTVILPILAIAFIVLFRFNRTRFENLEKGLFIFTNNHRKLIITHLILLLCSFFVSKFAGDVYVRVFSIVVPLIGYFYLSNLVFRNGLKYTYPIPVNQYSRVHIINQFIQCWVETPVFFLSFLTLVFLGFTDIGFGVIFLFFLILKNILINFSRRPRGGESRLTAYIIKPHNFWLYGIIASILLFIVITYKSFFDFVLHYKILFLCLSLCLAYLVFVLLNKNKRWNKPTGVVLILFMILIGFGFRGSVERAIDHKIRMTVYRTQILTKPINDILFNFEYNSTQEKKLIQTAQNQWFISNYLQADRKDKPIHLRPHFNTGVNYSTQTRDVVLSRYVIAEFGPFVMVLLLLALCVPLFLYFIAYSTYDRLHSGFKNGRFVSVIHSSSYIGGVALILLFSISLMVWLTSTNRIVFFGQDFPFISLTSKVSVITPLFLLILVLTSRPQERLSTVGLQRKIVNWVGFSILLFVFVMFSKDPVTFSDKAKNFRIDYSQIEKSIDSLNIHFTNFQQGDVKSANSVELHNMIDSFFRYDKVVRIMESIRSTNNYHFSIMDSVRKNPFIGFKANSPIYLKYNEITNKFRFQLNSNINTEPPPYEFQTSWKGNVLGKKYEQENTMRSIIQIPVNQPSNLIVYEIPQEYLKPGTGNLGIVSPRSLDLSEEMLIYNKSNKTLNRYGANTGTIIFKPHEILILKAQSVSVSNTEPIYFARNYTINGKQRFVYPLGESFYWVKNFADDAKDRNTSNSKDVFLTLDFTLTKNIMNVLRMDFNKNLDFINNSTFSVIASNSEGKIRLMADYVKDRITVDPNNTRLINKLKRKEFFFSDPSKEAKQWGNLNLIRHRYGPGSSMKPLIASSIAAGINAQWENIEAVISPQKIKKYAGIALAEKKWEEDAGRSGVGLESYISKSDNFYHSILFYLGSYTKDKFQNISNGTYSVQNVLTTNVIVGDNDTPHIKVNGSDYYFYSLKSHKALGPLSFKPFGDTFFFGNKQSLLSNGMKNYLNLSIEDRYIDKNVIKESYDSDSVIEAFKFPLAYPDVSNFKMSQMEFNSKTSVDFKLKFINPVHGGSPYDITPKKMIDMYGNLFSQKINFRSTILDNNYPPNHISWQIDPSWGGAINFEQIYLNRVKNSMQNTIIAGTAPKLNDFMNLYKEYNFYAKTGTIGKDGDKNYSSKRLVVVISKKSDDSKYYIVYFTGEEIKEIKIDQIWWTSIIKILDQIIRSDSFKKDMN